MPDNLILIRQLKGKSKAFEVSDDEDITEAQFENKVGNYRGYALLERSVPKGHKAFCILYR